MSTKADTAGNWVEMYSSPSFSKWGYKDSPYRVIVDLDKKRGHYRVLFTSAYGNGTDNCTVAGNLGGGATGYAKALSEAQNFFEENPHGCPPPGEYER